MENFKNKLTRIQKTLSCIEPDRVPVFELFWDKFIEIWKFEKNLPEDCDIYKYYDLDLAFVVPLTDPKIKSFEIIKETNKYIIFKSGYGCIVKKVFDIPMPQFLEFEIKNANQYAKYMFDNPNSEKRYEEKFYSITANAGDTLVGSFKEQLKKYDSKIPVCGSVCEAHEKIWRIRGNEGLWMDLITDREKVKDFVKRVEEFEISIGIKQIEMGIDVIFIGGDVAYNKGLFFSPQIWREVFKPTLKNMCKAFKDAKPDIKIIYHGCGNALSIFEDLIECGIDAYHSLEVKTGIDILDLKRNYKGRLAFIGNIDVRDVLTGSKEKIKIDVLRKLNAAKGGGYIPSADHSVPYNVPVENYEYFLNLVKKYGKYPLNLGEFDIKL